MGLSEQVAPPENIVSTMDDVDFCLYKTDILDSYLMTRLDADSPSSPVFNLGYRDLVGGKAGDVSKGRDGVLSVVVSSDVSITGREEQFSWVDHNAWSTLFGSD